MITEFLLVGKLLDDTMIFKYDRKLQELQNSCMWSVIYFFFFQVIKWMLSKGQGTTMGVYGQLIRALDMDDRPDEAHQFWEKKIGIDLHSVPWQLCKRMIAIYYRNNMLENLVRVRFFFFHLRTDYFMP